MTPEVVLNFSFMRVVKCVFGFVDEIRSIFSRQDLRPAWRILPGLVSG